MTVNKDKNVLEWAMGNPYLTDVPLLNRLNGRQGACAVIPMEGAAIKRYINGDVVRRYDFMLQVTFQLSEVTDSVNADGLFTLGQWMEWIEEQEREKNYPDFGDGCDVLEVKNLSGGPVMSQVFEDGKAKYQFPAAVVYLEKR